MNSFNKNGIFSIFHIIFLVKGTPASERETNLSMTWLSFFENDFYSIEVTELTAKNQKEQTQLPLFINTI